VYAYSFDFFPPTIPHHGHFPPTIPHHGETRKDGNTSDLRHINDDHPDIIDIHFEDQELRDQTK